MQNEYTTANDIFDALYSIKISLDNINNTLIQFLPGSFGFIDRQLSGIEDNLEIIADNVRDMADIQKEDNDTTGL